MILLNLIVSVVLLYVLTKIIWWCCCTFAIKSAFKSIQDIPGPVALPFLGTGWIFWRRYSTNKLIDAYEDLFKRYGSIFREETLFNIPVISLKEADDMVKVFKSSGKYPMRPPTEAIAHYRKSQPERYSSGGITNEQGPTWHALRSALTPQLVSTQVMTNFVPEMNAIAQDLCNLIKTKRNDTDCSIDDLKQIVENVGLEASCSLVLGRRMGFLLPGSVSPVAKKLADTMHRHFVACRNTYFGIPFWKLWETSSYKELARCEKEIYDLTTELIRSADEEARESPIFQSILNADIDEREKRAAIVDFIVAGISTLSNTLIFLLFHITKNFNCQTRIRANPLTGSSRYMKACIQESFRLLPTASLLARITETNLNLSGYDVPAGSVVLCQTMIACRDEKNFIDANRFNPDRWLNDEQHLASLASYLVIPFGIGKRACPGRRFIELALISIVRELTRQFTITCCQDELDVQFEFLLSAKGPIRMIFTDN